MKKLLGSHISFKAPKYLLGSVEASLNNGANSMMIYLGAPQNARRVDTSFYQFDKYVELYSEQIKPQNIIVHAPYIVNPASLEKFQFAIDFLIDEIKRMNFIGAKYLVLHPGAFTKFPIEKAKKRLIESLKMILDKTSNVDIALETMAGKGTEIGRTFEELKEIIDGVNSNRIGICIDTCHIWEAGYDIKNNLSFVMEQLRINQLVDKTFVIHVNDSKNPLGAHKDRHENLGKGEIGLKAIKKFIDQKEFDGIVKVLETPQISESIYLEELKLLK